MPRLRVDAVLLDLDGTVIDDTASYREAIRRTAEWSLSASVSRDEVDEVKRRPGFNNDVDTVWGVIGRRMHAHIRPPDAVDRGSYTYRRLQGAFETYYLGDRLWQQISGLEPPFSWSEPLMAQESLLVTHQVLAQLSRFVLGIVTSRPRVEALMALHDHNLDRYVKPDAVVTVDDVPEEKPHPAPVLALVERLGARHPVLVGDTINDALAALAAGVPFIHVGAEPLLDDEAERWVTQRIQAIDELIDLLESVDAV